jgi:hypothetical protein
VASAVFAVMASGGLPFDQLFWRNPVLLTALLFVGPALMFSEKWLHPDEWRRLKRASDACSFFDMLAFRHIPHVRVARFRVKG